MPTARRAASTGRRSASSARSGVLSTAGGRRSLCTGATSTSCWRQGRTPSSTTTTTRARGSRSVRNDRFPLGGSRDAVPSRGGEVSDTARAAWQHDALPAVSDTCSEYVELHAHSAYSFLDGASL